MPEWSNSEDEGCVNEETVGGRVREIMDKHGVEHMGG